MTTANDRALLIAYEEWSDRKVSEDFDLSVNGFLAEREAESNAARVKEALEYVTEALTVRLKADDEYLAAQLLRALERVRDILEDGRDVEYVDNRTLAGALRTIAIL